MTLFKGFPQDSHSFSAAEVGMALSGLVAREASGVPRVGMLGGGPTVGAAGSSWRAEVGRFVYVHQVQGAVQFSGSSAVEQVDIEPATGIPAGQARIDRVCWDPVAAVLTVVEGVPSTAPVLPSVGGFAPVARVRVNAGDGMVIAAQVTSDFVTTGMAGASPQTYVPTVSGYTTGFSPAMRGQYVQSGDVVEVELSADTDREIARVAGAIIVTVPVPIGGIAVDGGGYFSIGPVGARRLYELRARKASPTQVVVEMLRVDARGAELVPLTQGGFAAGVWMSWVARLRYTAA